MVNCILIAALTVLPFDFLVQADVFVMSLSYILLYVAYCILRCRDPHKPRPFRLPAVHPLLTIFYIFIPTAMVLTQIATAPNVVIISGACVVGAVTMLYLLMFMVYPWGKTKFKRKYKPLPTIV